MILAGHAKSGTRCEIAQLMGLIRLINETEILNSEVLDRAFDAARKASNSVMALDRSEALNRNRLEFCELQKHRVAEI